MAELQQNTETADTKSSSFYRDFLTKFGALFGLLILCIILSFSTEYFFTVDNMFNITRQASIIAILALAVLLPILTSGIDLSVGSLLALSAMVMGVVSVNWGLGPVLGIISCLAVGAFFGWLNGLALTKLRLPHPFISTLGMMNIARGFALIITGAAPIAGFAFSIQYIGSGSIGPVPVSFLVVIFLYVAMHFFLTRTTIGTYIYAIGGNKEAARLSGINVDKILILVYTSSGLLAGVAGLVMVGRVDSAFPLAGMGYELDAIAAVIIGGASLFGGIGTVWGTMIGTLIIAVLRNGLNLLNVSSDLQMTIIGAVIILAVYIDVLRQRGQTKEA
ncbi:ABC transporter permease [Alkalicoccobacillus murimartini]|uniref:Ribose transport system permease protein n=1 Tax=Alkalicoccobacillus murimartini TaxID=171685 RepID=A0ABT9YHN1_9BACI|nr:ABC transporter permease [Alkalicoccobacillus murimartini]MDQ0207204.1 ribose transport system permease protein [Alkalicoccobacillus murimartini]